MKPHILDEKLFFPLRDTKCMWTSSRAAFTSFPKQSSKTNTLVLQKAQTSCPYQGTMEAVVFHLFILFWLRGWLAQINSPPYILPWQLSSDKVLHLTSDQIKMFWAFMTRVLPLAQQNPTFFLPFPELYENDEKFWLPQGQTWSGG